MRIDIKLLEKCPVLTDYENDLIKRIDTSQETQASVAKSLGKSPATISIQHKKALEKFNVWLNKREKEKVLPEEIDKQVFKMLNKGIAPARIVAKVGRAREVAKFAELWQQLNSEDSWQTVDLLRENGMLFQSYAVDRPLVYSLNKLIQSHDATKTQLKEMEETVEALEQRTVQKDKQIRNTEIMKEIFRIEKEELSGLKVYADLTDEQIQQRREIIRKLDGEVKGLKSLRLHLNLEVDRAKRIIFDLHTKTRETVKEYLSRLDNMDIWKLVAEAKWGKINPLIAKVFTSQT